MVWAFFAKHTDVDRHLAPAKKKQPALFQHILGDGFGPRLRVGIVVRQKHHPDREITLLVKRVSQPRDFGHKKFVGNLRHHPRAIASFGVGIKGAAMHQIADGAQTNAQDSVGAPAADLGDKSDTARIMFVSGIVEIWLRVRARLAGGLHAGVFPKIMFRLASRRHCREGNEQLSFHDRRVSSEKCQRAKKFAARRTTRWTLVVDSPAATQTTHFERRPPSIAA